MQDHNELGVAVDIQGWRRGGAASIAAAEGAIKLRPVITVWVCIFCSRRLI